MNKSAILHILAILLAISIVIGFDVCWYYYITDTLKNYEISQKDTIERLDSFFSFWAQRRFLPLQEFYYHCPLYPSRRHLALGHFDKENK